MMREKKSLKIVSQKFSFNHQLKKMGSDYLLKVILEITKGSLNTWNYIFVVKSYQPLKDASITKYLH